MEFKAICNVCPVVNDCKAAFGKFWVDKSNGGKGCTTPFDGWIKAPPPEYPKMPRRKAKQMEFI